MSAINPDHCELAWLWQKLYEPDDFVARIHGENKLAIGCGQALGGAPLMSRIWPLTVPVGDRADPQLHARCAKHR